MEDDKIKYEDLVSPDDSIKVLINQLTELNKTYGSTLEVIKAGAKEIISQLKSMSAATNEGKAEIDEAAIAANRLARAQKELKFAMSDTGKEVAWLKSQTASQNKMTIESRKAISAVIDSYDGLKASLKEQVGLWKSLSEAERASQFGQDLLADILRTKDSVDKLNSSMKAQVTTMSAVEKAQKKLDYLRTAEGRKLLQIKEQIAEEIKLNKTKKDSIDEVAQAQARLDAAVSAARLEANALNIQAKEQNRISKLTAQLTMSQKGSYNALAAQYELNKIKLNAMSGAERTATESGKKLEAETAALYQQMIKLQEAVGNHRLSVGHYAKSWDGLGISVSQVVRELPAAAVSMNTFFLGISNNIPILMDEINKLKAENKELIAQGKQAKSVIGSVARALFSWNTVLVVGLTVLSMHGKAIIDWIGNLFKGRKAAISYTEAVDNINKELEKTNDSYGKHITTIKQLSREWKNLSDEKQQLQWIKDNKTAFDQLDVSINNVNDAENLFVDHTDVMIDALKSRAKAAAAMKLAADKYEEALVKEAEAEAEVAKGQSTWDVIRGGLATAPGATGQSVSNASQQSEQLAEGFRERRIQNLRDEAAAAEATADQYFNMADAINAEADAKLREAGIDSKHRKTKERERPPRLRDLTDQIWRNDLTIRKKYELSLSELQRNEFEKRRIEAVDQANQTIREMQEKFRKNEVFLTNPDGKFKPLTPEQRQQILRQQNEINAIIENTRRKLEMELTDIEYEYEVDRNKKLRQVMDWRIDTITKDIEKEKQLRLEQLEQQERLYATKGQSAEGEEIVVTGGLTPEEIAEFQRKREQIIAEYDNIIYNMKAKSIDNQLELVRKGSQEELSLLIEQNEAARKIALAQNKLKPAESRQDEAEINAVYNKRGQLIVGENALANFDEAQAAAKAEFDIVKHNENQITIFKLKAERDRWKKLIYLAKAGALDWSDTQLREAEATVSGLERQIKEAGSLMNLIGEKGLGGGLLTKLGFNEDQIAALSEAANIIIDNIKMIADAEVKAAEMAVAAAEKRVEAAQAAYDAEVEGRNNGYANNVATAKKELQQEKKNQAQKQKLLEEAQRKQERLNTLTQASSLITASANLWSAFSSIPIAGPALALAAIAAMWTSFAVAKVKANQITQAASQEYGEGGLEFLEGGSHASGHDIDLRTKNSRGKNMRAEGGEALAIINKRSTRRYRRVLPQIVDSLNRQTFEDKFSQAFKTGEELSQTVYQQSGVDLSELEENVRAIKRSSEEHYYILPDGTYIEKRGNVLRKIH